MARERTVGAVALFDIALYVSVTIRRDHGDRFAVEPCRQLTCMKIVEPGGPVGAITPHRATSCWISSVLLYRSLYEVFCVVSSFTSGVSRCEVGTSINGAFSADTSSRKTRTFTIRGS